MGRFRARGAFRRWVRLVSICVLVIPMLGVTGRAGAATARGPVPASDRVTDPDSVLPAGWRTSPDRAVVVAGDATGLHVLVAEAAHGYAWRMVTTLGDPDTDAVRWIGQACVTGDGRRAVVVYAPSDITNHADAFGDGARAAIVDLTGGAVTELGVGVSIAYFNPGCGTGDEVVLTQGGTGAGHSQALASTSRLVTVNAATGKVTADVRVPGQVTSAVPYAGQVAAVTAPGVVAIDHRGNVRQLAGTSGTALRLVPDAAGGLGYEVATATQIQVHRLVAGRDATLGTAALGAIALSETGGRVFVTGPRASALHSLPSSWRAVDAPADTTVSTTGALAVTAANTPLDAPDAPQVVSVSASVTGTGKALSFAVPTAALPARTAARKAAASPLAAADPGTVTYDPDRTCSVARNDPKVQTYQPSTAEEEWAVDEAVHDGLTHTRGPNLYQSGLAAYTPLSMFPPPGLAGGSGTVPAQVLLGILAQESAEYQASNHAIIGQTGNFMPSSNWYGDNGIFTSVNFAAADCGYGTGQITTGMCRAGVSGCTNPLPSAYQLAIAVDYQANIAAALQILEQKWNELVGHGITANGADPRYLENWFFALWDYNSGLHPDDGSGIWGLGWVNNPVNPNYPADREPFLSGNYDYDVAHPSHWSYEEKVLGYARYGLYRWDFVHQADVRAYQTGNWSAGVVLPPRTLFCTAANNCDPTNTSAPCQLASSKCWWHTPVSWAGNCQPNCGTEVLAYPPGAPAPGYPGVPAGYPADCGAPAATVIDDVPSSAPAALGDCSGQYLNDGSISWTFGSTTSSSGVTTYPSKIDLHQIGAGYGGHFWFTHSIVDNPTSSRAITGTWTPPASVTGWTEILAHIPNYGAWDPEARYEITPGSGQPVAYRIVNQAKAANTWVRLGVYHLSAGAHVSLSNGTDLGLGRDIAWDAMAFQASLPSTYSYVAMGDSYSAGEGLQPYDPDSDNPNSKCHRSSQAYSRLVTRPGHTQPIAAEAAAVNSTTEYAHIACGFAETTGITEDAVDNPPTSYDLASNTDWLDTQYDWGEPPQADQGWLGPNTNLVTLTIGGNDARFIDVLNGCIRTMIDCTASTYHLTRLYSPNAVDPQPLVQFEPLVIGQLQTHLEIAYQTIHRIAPNAEIIVLGYPRLFPTTPDPKGCGIGLDFTLSASDTAWLNQMGDLLDTTIGSAVSTVKSEGVNVRYIDPRSAFTGHSVCDGDARWINGLINWADSGSGHTVIGPGSFHPTAEGQRQLARLVNTCLAGTISC